MPPDSTSDDLAARIVAAVDRDRVTSLASKLMSIKSWDREGESRVADFCAAYMEGMGLSVEIQDVPVTGAIETKQAIGLLKGSTNRPNLLLCAHLDTVVPYGLDLWTKPFGYLEDKFVYGTGGQKCALAAMLEAVRVLKDTVDLRGSITMACEAEEMTGGLGIERILNSKPAPDFAIVGEDSDLELTTTAVAGIFGTIEIEGRPDKPKGVGINALKKILELLRSVRAFETTPPGDWLTFQPHPEMPGFPRFGLVSISIDPVEYPFRSKILFDCRIVPGQDQETIRKDLEVVIKKMKDSQPGLSVELQIPASGWYNRVPFVMAKDSPMVKLVAKWHEQVVGKQPFIGAGKRLGFASDANNFVARGIPCVNYGPGDFEQAIDERKKNDDIVAAAKVYALSAAELCG